MAPSFLFKEECRLLSVTRSVWMTYPSLKLTGTDLKEELHVIVSRANMTQNSVPLLLLTVNSW